MAQTRTVDFLPEIFQTTTNRQFLGATLDQLVQEPSYKQTQGFIGRHVGPGVNPNDHYVTEPDATRANYQLEPGVISLNPDNTTKITDAITYPGITDALRVQGAAVNRADRLYTSDYYTWDPFINFDKFVNFSQYYWLPAGPDSVDVGAELTPLTNTYTVTYNSDNSYSFSGINGVNPSLTLVRGGNYDFDVNQLGHNFWIQATPGVSGKLPSTPNISSRDVFGVVNNGEDVGTVQFNVPLKNAQQFYYDLTSLGNVDLVTNLLLSQLNGMLVSDIVSTYGGIDGITSLNNRTIVFTNPSDTTSAKEGIWLITYTYNEDNLPVINLGLVQPVANLEKFTALFGTQWSGTTWYKDAEGFYQEVPLLTAIQDVLYYQDGTDPDAFGIIRLIDQNQVITLNVDDIIGKKTYTSPNGVVFTNNLKIQFVGSITPTSYANKEYYVAGVGTAIQLLPVTNYTTPEQYTKNATVAYDSTPYDVGNFDANLSQPLVPDYITIGLDSPDLNAWARSNRWFHIDVINASAAYNNTTAVLDNNFRAKRPIVEFRGGTRLFDMGTEGKQPINIIDFNETDALSNINGTIGYTIDGYSFVNGTRVIFAADSDPEVRNKIYQVQFIEPNSDGSTLLEPIINLVPASDADVLVDQSTVCINGLTLAGKSFFYDGITWYPAQLKTDVNQPPLFNVYDQNGISLSDRVVYPSSTFAGSKLFAYTVGTGTTDPVLGFALKYISLRNVGDISFTNHLYTDTFIYVENSVSVEVPISKGFVRQYADRTIFQKEIGWQNAVTKSQIYQQFSFTFALNTPLQLDVAVVPTGLIPSVKVYVGSVFQDPGTYTVTTTATTTTVTLSNTAAVVGDTVEVLALSNQASSVGFYQVPINLENNPLNQNPDELSLGTIRTHYETIGENLVGIVGKINGANNIRDLGNIVPYGLNILQQSAPMTLAGYFMRSQDYNIFGALEFNNREYEQFKIRLLNNIITEDYINLTIPQTLTAAIQSITSDRTELYPFYWSDMLPAGSVYTQTSTTIGPISTNVFDTVQTYNFTSANYLGLLVYLNDQLLTRGLEYTVSTTGPSLTIEVPLAVGDVVVIQEYATTYGNYVPNTPTKMGLYPAFKPEIYVDNTYVTPVTVIRGHDGSITKAFGDLRDQVLLEFETRIYNNLKLDGNPVPLSVTEVIPGQFRTTDYDLGTINQILGQDFLTWVGWNKLDYKAQDYIATNEFTYNYGTASNKIANNQPLVVGAWRGIYNYFYDTINPNSRPWEMLGFSIEPTWWVDVYGTAPYTSGNLVLWDDLELGLVRDPAGTYILPQYARPGLSQVIPAGDEGQLLSPLNVMVGNYDKSAFHRSWAVGDDGPVESSWKTSSSYPFAVMRLLALTRPAEFFSLFADRDLYKYNTDVEQYLYNGRYRLDANGIEVYGNGLSKASFVNWIVDFNRLTGANSTDTLSSELQNLDVRLCYRMASFSAKNLLNVYTEKSSPNSLNSSLLLPDESYNLLFYKNVPFDRLTYSSIIVQAVDGGYAVYGYSTTHQYFSILQSQVNGKTVSVSSGGQTVRVPVTYTNKVVQVPYGYVFTNRTVVADFLLSYGALLQSQGMVFNQKENGYFLDWNQMVNEFLYWSAQGWSTGSVINLNPNATTLVIDRPGAIVDNIAAQTQESLVLNQQSQRLDTKNLIVDRIDNTFSITTTVKQTISYLDVKFVSFEHMIVLDNESIFADLIYRPVTGARQNRVRLAGATTTDWNGQLNAPGFILNQDNISEWQVNTKYPKGAIVSYKNFYYSANTIVQPSDKFNFNDWTKSDYTRIQQGLLPNLANKSNELETSYSVFNTNLELDQDLFSFGLIGFKPRQYMASLNLDSVSQVQIYKQFLGSKGTTNATDIFGFADLGRGPAEYNIYENWGVQRSVYGANANRSYYEIQLNEALLQSDPSIIQVVEPNTPSAADQTVQVTDLWKTSYAITSPDILTTTTVAPTDISLPSAGYVNLNDADITVFDINDPISLGQNLSKIVDGAIVWAAKVNNYDWDIYRASKVPGKVVEVASNLDGTSVVTFSTVHGLTADAWVAIKSFAAGIDGVYQVISTPSIQTIVIEYSFPSESNQIMATGDGVAFTLVSQRVSQASDVSTLPYANSLQPGVRVWVDNNGSGLWEVLEKQDAFTASRLLDPKLPVLDSNFGQTVAQSNLNLFALVGSPTYTSTGGVYSFVRTDTDPFSENGVLLIGATATTGYGSSVSIGNQVWAAAGAPTSDSNKGYATVIYRVPGSSSFAITSLLTNPNAGDLALPSKFGTSVLVTDDERWLYVGAPGVNAVYAYGRVDVETQSKRFFTDGTEFSFTYSDSIIIESAQYEQLTVILNNRLLVYGVDYNVTATSVILTSTPPKDLLLTINRRESKTFTGDGATRTYSVNEYLYNATDIESMLVSINGVPQRPNIDYVFNADYSSVGRDITFVNAPALDALINIATQTYFKFTRKIEATGAFTGTVSGNTLTVTDVVAGSIPLTIGTRITGSGVDQTTRISAYGTGTGGGGTYVLNTSSSLSSQSFTAYLPDDAAFGSSLAATTDGRQVMIGAPYDTVGNDSNAGSVYLFDRAVQRFIVSDTSVTTYTVDGGQLIAPTSVMLNNEFLVNKSVSLTGQYSVSGSSVIFDADVLSIGDIIEIDINTFNVLQKLQANSVFDSSLYGASVDMCQSNCSMYVGAPLAPTLLGTNAVIPESGSVDALFNQSRIYGVTTSTNTSPTLTPGNTIRINNTEVALSTPSTWNSLNAWAASDFVENGGSIYYALQYVPIGTLITDTTYWQASSWPAVLAADINSATIPNVVASAGTLGTQQGGLLTISVINTDAATPGLKLTVLPGLIGNMFNELGWDTAVWTQTITSPYPVAYANFGTSVVRDLASNNLIIGAPYGTLVKTTTFDQGTTYFDSKGTTFFAPVVQSGVVYTYDYLSSAVDSITTPGQYAFGQQIYNDTVQSLDRFGIGIDYHNGVLMIGAPGHDTGDSSLSELNYGRVNVFSNPNIGPSWVPVHIQQPVVDISLINGVFTYDKVTSAKTAFFDFFDPLQGKILGAARQNIDYIGAVDPAAYNAGEVNNYGKAWGGERVGQIWWDTNNVRFIDPNQDDIVYAARRWGQLFPGSSVDVYQWIASPVPPANYTGEGTVKSGSSYTVGSTVTPSGTITATYYFWVRGINSIDAYGAKTLSTVGIASYIESPRTSGIPYVAFLDASATGIYNALNDISAQDTILSIEFDREYTNDNVHTEYSLIPQDRADGFLPDILYRKLQDSFCGVDLVGNKVPDITLSPANRYGVQFRPRQSMFADRYVALKNYLTRCNTVLAQYPISETRDFTLLNSFEPQPAANTGAWDKRVANIEELSFQNFVNNPVGYKYLVDSDSREHGLWTIYEVTADQTFETLLLIQVETYDTRLYWSYIDWYTPGYNTSQQIAAEVANYASLSRLSVPVGSSVKVTANSQGKWEIYLLDNTGWTRVGLQDGTIEFSNELWDYSVGRFGFDIEVFDAQYFDQEPVIETRKIIQAINQQLLIGDLLIERNRALVLIFNVVLQEFEAPEWLVKTSLIDVEHKIRQLLPYQIYRQDNQDFVVEYIKEVKPYHVSIREINLIYDGLDVYQGSTTDFDLPAYYNTDLIPSKYTSPVLLPYELSTAQGTGANNTDSDTPADSPLWTQYPYNQWYNNYLLEIEGVSIIDGGTGYTVAPTVIVTGDSITPATIVARINSAGKVNQLIVVDPGSGYTTTAVITLEGGNGTGARAVCTMGNGLVRNIKTTIKYDRYQYQTTIVNWTANTVYTVGTQVRYLDKVWQAYSPTGDSTVTGATFDPEYWQLVDAGTLSGVDRTMGLYVPSVNEPGLDLPLLIDGVEYPGVQVLAPSFSQNTGFDVGNFDINPFDNISYGPDGQPTYDPGILDAIYESPFNDPYLGTRATDINVDGGAFIDTYSSYAPEELVPGAEFDTLDFRVYTRPGQDFNGNGFGFAWKTVKWVYDSLTDSSAGFDNIVPNPVQVQVTNQTQGRELTFNVDYSVNWNGSSVAIIPSVSTPPAANGDILVISVFGIGGGNQLFKQGYNGSDVVNQELSIPVSTNEIDELVIFVNGYQITNFTFTDNNNETIITFASSYTLSDYINITALGFSGDSYNYSWSTPITEEFVSDGGLTFKLANSLQGTNPANLIVEKNGIRARPAEGVEYAADGSTAYGLPTRGGYSQSLIADNDVSVWVNNQPLTLYADFVVEPYTSEDDVRSVELFRQPSDGSTILISVSTKADYVLQNDGSSLYNSVLSWRTTNGFYPIQGDIVTVTTWNDTSQQQLLTEVFQGPITTGITLNEAYDSTDFDIGDITNDTGSFDYTEGDVVSVNDFQLGRTITDPSRLWVTKNGQRKFYGDDYVINGQELILHGPVINTTDVVVVTEFTDSVVPEAMAFRIFQDMRNIQATYRMTPSTTTYITQELTLADDVIYVANASALSIPNLVSNTWGVLTINGERIMYRSLDIENNTVSGLRRGTAGTGAAVHAANSIVYNIGRGNLAPVEYQDRFVFKNFMGDNVTTTFTADTIDVDETIANADRAILVYVGGTYVETLDGYTIDSYAPVSIQFTSAPAEGSQVSIAVRRGLSWYEPGNGDASNGVELQETNTLAARFFRGL